MIFVTTQHGRTKRDINNLYAHLSDSNGQTSCIVKIVGSIFDDGLETLFDFARVREGSRASVALHHMVISPAGIAEGESVRGWTADELDRVIARVLTELGASDHGYILWQHAGKARADGAAPDTHFHLVVSHIGRDLKALDDGHLYFRLERLAAELSFDLGERAIPVRHDRTVFAHLTIAHREDVAAVVSTVQPEGRVNSAMTAAARIVAARQGVDLAKSRALVADAWAQSDDRASFEHALAETGLRVTRSPDRPETWVIMRGDLILGAARRFLHVDADVIANRMAEPSLPVEIATVDEPSSDQGSEGGGAQIIATVQIRPPKELNDQAESWPLEAKPVGLSADLDETRTSSVGANILSGGGSYPTELSTAADFEDAERERQRARLRELLNDAIVRCGRLEASPPPSPGLIDANWRLECAKHAENLARRTASRAESALSKARNEPQSLLMRVLPWKVRERRHGLATLERAVASADQAYSAARAKVGAMEVRVECARMAHERNVAKTRQAREAQARAASDRIAELNERIQQLDEPAHADNRGQNPSHQSICDESFAGACDRTREGERRIASFGTQLGPSLTTKP